MAPLYGTDTTDGLRRWKFVTMPHQRSRRGHGCPVRAGSASLEMAVRNCQPIKGVTIFHSDRGSQYTSADYTATMNKYGFLASVGRTGVCYDNAAAESFNATCKKELVNRKIYHTRRKAIKEVTSWIELCYNQTRLHPSLGYRTPNEVHQEWRKTKTAA